MESSKTIKKWFWVWSFEKEEDWLNEMAMNGWVLESVSMCSYHFVRCEPGEYSVRLEMHPYDEDYPDDGFWNRCPKTDRRARPSFFCGSRSTSPSGRCIPRPFPA